jgi:YVTN family beta-propeller protein
MTTPPASLLPIFLCFSLLLVIPPLQSSPAGTQPAKRAVTGESILPGGRRITPLGDQFFTGPGPFGLAVSRSGKYVATADGGPARYAITILQNADGYLRHLVARSPEDPKSRDDDWRSVFMGVAFDGDSRLFASEGESGRVRVIDAADGKRIGSIDLNQGQFHDSYTADLALDTTRHLLYVVDQANFRMAIVDSRDLRLLSSVATGLLPFALTCSPDRRKGYVTNLGMFQYQPIPGADPRRARETGLPFPAFGFPSKEARTGVRRRTEGGWVSVPPLGNQNAPTSNSLSILNVESPTAPYLEAFVRTGRQVGRQSIGGSSPSGVLAVGKTIYVSNANQDTVSVINSSTGFVEREISLRAPGYESLRGILPIGLAYAQQRGWLLIAEAGINAVGVVDVTSQRLIGHIPVGWFPTQIRIFEDVVFVSNAKGHGTGPNADHEVAKARSFQGVLRRGTISRFPLPKPEDLPELTKRVLENNGLNERSETGAFLPGAIDHVVIIVKENRTYDEVFGDLPAAANGSREGVARLARFGRRITPNHHAMAERWSSSDNFYADSEVSVDGHHWIVDSYPNAWTNSTWMAAYGGEKSFRLPTSAPGQTLVCRC